MACPSEMWVLGMPGMSQIRLRCVRESLCTAGVWPSGIHWAVMQVVCHLVIAGPRKPSDLHCPNTWGARWLAWWFWTGALAERTRKPPRCVAAVQNSTKEKGWGWQLWLLCWNAQSIQITEYLWSEQSIGMTCGAGGYLAHRSICKTPLKVLSKALVKLGKSKMLGDVGSRISPSGCVEFLGKTLFKHLQMLSFVNFRNRFWQFVFGSNIMLDHFGSSNQHPPKALGPLGPLDHIAKRCPVQALLEDASLKQRKWLTSTDCYTLCQAGYPLRHAKIRQVWTCFENSWVMLHML